MFAKKLMDRVNHLTARAASLDWIHAAAFLDTLYHDAEIAFEIYQQLQTIHGFPSGPRQAAGSAPPGSSE